LEQLADVICFRLSNFRTVISDSVAFGHSCAGCFFTSSGGLRSFEHPLKELKPVPWMDGSGQQCGSTYVVFEDSKKNPKQMGMPRVGSDADWSNQL